MGLKNFQYNKILREYDKRQLENRHILEKKKKEIYSKIPEFSNIDHMIASNSVMYAKLAIGGDEKAIDHLKKKNQQLSIRKKQLLLENKYPANFLTPSFHCPFCQDTGYIANTKCHCFKQAIVDLIYSQSNIQSAIVKENFNSFCYDFYPKNYVDPQTGLTPFDNIHRVVDCCKNFIKYLDKEYKNLLLYGNTGVGKTFLANCIAKEILDTSHTVIYLTAFQLFDILEKNKFFKGETNFEIEDQFSGILNCDLLIIDDLGTELTNAFISSQLYLCMNERHLNRKSTIISTNFSLDDLNSHYSERIFSRIASDYSLLKIVGDDIRLKKAFSP